MLESLLMKFSGALHMILGFSFLIFIHELGHFALAKWNGVRVYVFSLGMGPYLFSFTYKGTVYALSMLPIGGYVKMMGQDDMNADLATTKDKSDYRNKRPGQKAAILAAGAIFNLIFALFAFTVCYYKGIHFIEPRLGNVSPDRPLATAVKHEDKQPAHLKRGDLLLSVNHIPVKNWLEAAIYASGTPRGEDLWLKVERPPEGGEKGNVDLVIVHPQEDKRLGATSIGLERPFVYYPVPLGFETKNNMIVLSDPKESSDTADMPAAKAGLKKNDILIAIHDPDHPEHPPEKRLDTMTAQEDFTNMIRDSKGRRITLTVVRGTETIRVDLVPVIGPKSGVLQIGLNAVLARREVTKIDENSEAYKVGLRAGHFVIGFKPDVPNEDVWNAGKLMWKTEWDSKEEKSGIIKNIPGSHEWNYLQYRTKMHFYKDPEFARALGTAWDDLWNYSRSVFGVLRGLVSGDVSHKALSGAVGIGASMYTVANNEDFMNFLWFLGFISLNLGVLQFLPVPLLDGWHLLMLVVEKIKGAPVSMEWQIRFQYVGLFMIGGLLILSFYNDIRNLMGL